MELLIIRSYFSLQHSTHQQHIRRNKRQQIWPKLSSNPNYTFLLRHGTLSSLENGKMRSFFEHPCLLLLTVQFGCKRNSVNSSALLARVNGVGLLYPLLPQIYAHYDDFSIPFSDFYCYLLALRGDRSSTSHVCKNDLFDYRKRKLLFLRFEIWR